MANEVPDNSMVAPGMEEPGEASESSFQEGAETSTVSYDADDDKTVYNEDVDMMMIEDEDHNEKTLEDECDKYHDKNTLEDAEKLMEEGSTLANEGQFDEAADCYSRALEIRVAHFGELAPECVSAYCKYGCALLYKTGTLDSMLKKEEGSHLISNEDCSTTEANHFESFTTCIFGNVGNDESSVSKECATDLGMKGQEENNENDTDDAIETDEDESELDLAWKMLDIARVIAEKQPAPTMEKVEVLSALAEVAFESDDIQTALGDYLKASSILETLVEPDSRHIAELKFMICLCQELCSKPKEAIYSCWKALTICNFRKHCLIDKLFISSSRPTTVNISSIPSRRNKMEEIEAWSVLSKDLETKLKELQNLDIVPAPISLKEVLDLGIVSAKVREVEKSDSNSSNVDLGVRHIGKVGGSVKRVCMNSDSFESSFAKKIKFEDKTYEGVNPGFESYPG